MVDEKQIMISVIIPVYNSEKYLKKCIDSVLAQSYQDFELILVNDGSTDRSGVICDEYAEQDNRVNVFHQKNKGVSAARNLGIKNVNGKWICFVDADDFINEKYLENFIRYGLNKDVINFHGHVKIDNNSKTYSYIKDSSFSIDNIDTQLLLDNGYIWAKLLNTELIRQHKIRFSENVRISEDLIFLLHYIKYVRKIELYECYDYNYCIHDASATHKIYSFEGNYNVYQTLKETYDNFFGLENDSIKNNLGLFLIYTISSIYRMGYTREQRINYLIIIKKEDIQFLLHTYRKTSKLFLLFFLKRGYIHLFDLLMAAYTKMEYRS